MRSISWGRGHRFRFRSFLLMALLVTGPIQWIEIFDVGLSFRLVHIPFFALAILGFTDFLRGRVTARHIFFVRPFVICYTIYLVGMLLPSISGSFSSASLIKIFAYAISALGIYFACSDIESDEISRALQWASVIAVVGFIVVATGTLSLRGISLIDTVAYAVGTGDAKALQFKIFYNLFNESSIRTESTVNVSLRNTLVGFFIMTFAFSMSAVALGRTHIVNYLSAGGSALIILISVSRSNIIVLLIVCLFGFMSLMKNRSRISVLVSTLIGSILSISPLLIDFSGLNQILSDRVQSFGSDGRIDMYAEALYYISESPYFGHGIGYTIKIHGEELMVHNLFLASWLQGGLVSLFGAIGFILATLYFVTSRLSKYWSDPSSLFVLGIAFLPLFRSQISGDAGNFTLPEWTALTICASYFFQMERKRYAIRVLQEISTTAHRRTDEFGPAS